MDYDPDFKPGLPEVLNEVEVDFEHEDAHKPLTMRKKNGRPVKSKTKKTVFKEQMQEHFEKTMRSDFKYVLANVVQEARDGNMNASKMLMDRVIPVSKAVDLNDLNKGVPLININIGSLEDDKVVSEQ